MIDKTPMNAVYAYPADIRNAITFFAENEYFRALTRHLYRYWNA